MESSSAKTATIHRVDRDHGDPRPAYEKMGSPRYPTAAQLSELRKAAALPRPEVEKLKDHELTLQVAAQGLAVIELK